MIDAYASLPHFLAHLRPIWDALPPDRRGTLYLAGAAARMGVTDAVSGKPKGAGAPVMVASFGDARAVRPRPYVYVEHGVGQRYDGDPATARHPSYSGGREHDRCVLFLSPREEVAARWREAYPLTSAVAVGVPKMDRWHENRHEILSEIPTVALSFHADIALVPETRSAWQHYDKGLPALKAWADVQGIRLFGHGHPRVWPHLRQRWADLGIEATADFDEVLARADVYVCDNSSTIYEAASVGIPVVVLDCPRYRRDVHHGLRFWDMADVGVQCEGPAELPDAIEVALADPLAVAQRRQEVTEALYPLRDGRAAERAAAAITDVLSGFQVDVWWEQHGPNARRRQRPITAA